MPSSRWLPSRCRTSFHWSGVSLYQSAGTKAPGPSAARSSAMAGSSTRDRRMAQKATRLASAPLCGWA